MHLLTTSSAKTDKGETAGYLTGILYMYPDAALCPASTPACRAACLVGSGRARIFPKIEAARRERTRRYREDRTAFLVDLCRDLEALARKARRERMQAALRLNGTSDAPPEDFRAVYRYSADLGITTYEYTKRRDVHRVEMHTTYSLATPDAAIVEGQANAQVFALRRSEDLPETYRGFRVIDGDRHDLRFLDRIQHNIAPDETYIVGLRLKSTTTARNAYAKSAGFAV